MVRKKLKEVAEFVFLGDTNVNNTQFDNLHKYVKSFNRLPSALKKEEDLDNRYVVLSDIYGYGNPAALRRDYGVIISPGEVVCQVRDVNYSRPDNIKVAGTYILRNDEMVRLKPKKGIERLLKFGN